MLRPFHLSLQKSYLKWVKQMRRSVEQWILREQDSSPPQIYLSPQSQKYNLRLTY